MNSSTAPPSPVVPEVTQPLPQGSAPGELEQLRHRLGQVHEELGKARQEITQLQLENESYKKSLLAWARRQLPEEELRRLFLKEEKGYTLSEFLPEIAKIVQESANG